MRALFLITLLLAVPVAATAKDGAGQCLWRTVPQLVRDQTILVYGRDGRSAFLETMAGMGDRLTPEALGACLGATPPDDAITPIADAFNAYALETAAAETLARRAGRPVSAVQALWPGLTAEQRELFRKIAAGGELEIDGVQSRVVVPAIARGELVGVLVALRPQRTATPAVSARSGGGLIASDGGAAPSFGLPAR